MANFYLWATFGLCLLKLCLTETQFNVSCRYGGVFHVEKNGRYSLTRTEAIELCRALNSTLATLEQFERAHELGFETCRYGFIVGHIVIPRINPYHLCAANHTGIYKLSANTTGRYDAYCYNATESRSKACEPVERIDTSFLSNQSEIVIDNEDGSRYNADGTRHSGDSSTSGVDDENLGSGSIHDTTPGDTSIRRSSPSYYGSVTPISHMPDHSSGGGEKDLHVKEYGYESSPTSTVILATANDFPTEDDVQHPASTTPEPHRDNLEKTTTQSWWNPFSDQWWWSYPREKTQEPTQPTRADMTSSGNGSDDEDSSEEMIYSTAFPGWEISVAKNEYAPSTTPEPHHDNLEKTTTQSWWNLFSDQWWLLNPREKTQEPTQSTRAVDSQHEMLLDVSTQDYWKPSYTDEEERYPSSAGRALVTSETEKRQGPTQHPLLHSAHYGWISQGQNPAYTTGATEQQEFTPPGENDIEKETSYTAMVSNHGAKQNDSAQDPFVNPGWGKEDYSTQPTIMDRVIPSRESNHEKETSNTALATPDGAPHEDPTQPTLPSENEAARSTEGVTHSTDAPGGPVLLGLDPVSTDEAGEESLLMSTIAVSTDVFHPEEATSRPLAPTTQPGSESGQANATDGSHVSLIPEVFPDIDDHLYQLPTHLSTTLATPDGAPHEDPTQPTLPSENEAARSTEGITHSTDAPGGPVLLGLDPISTDEAGEESLLTSTITDSNDALKPEDVTQKVWTSRVIDTAFATSDDGARHEDPTQPTLPSENEAARSTEGVTHSTDAPGGPVLLGLDPISTDEAGEESLLMSTIAVSTDVFHPEEATSRPLAPTTQPGSESGQANATDGSHVSLIPEVFPDIDDRLYQLPTPLSPRSTSNIDSDQGPYDGDSEPTPFPGESTTTTVRSQPKSAPVPEWLIIVAALLALALILAVCIAVNSRRRCGQKKKLVINNGKGAVEDRKTRELNGDASKSQEMVHLVHKEQSNDQTGACDEFLTVDETQNHEVDMKSGV
ncbi:CD44 antigen isoform X3 [Meleagris gallopavo]|uniref:CD44 antigen isoform X3 n=1 Tax=Meleagris gallopavo TaxID=9103 RepID=UPI000549B013|nr:CD44 antigen isoform X3 [Meleagris gallopavo]